MSLSTQKPIRIFQGELNPPIRLRIVDQDGKIRALGSPTEISVDFLKTDGGTLSKLLSTSDVTIVSDAGGQITVALTAADTNSMKSVNPGDMIVTITTGSDIRKVRYVDLLIVDDGSVDN